MKIVHCLNHFLPQQVAGTEVYTFSLIKELQGKGVDCLVLIPHYKSGENHTYEVDGVRVVQYAEPSVVDRSLKMGRRPADGLQAFAEVLKAEQPDVVHFHELAGSNGISMHHVKAAKALGFRVVMTFHLAGYSCRTGSLMYKDKELCDGVIDRKKCSMCFLHQKGYERYSPIIWNLSSLLYNLRIDTSVWQNKLGTSLSFPFLIDELKTNLEALSATADRMVLLTSWYHKVLLRNGLPADKMKIITQGLPVDVPAGRTPQVKPARPVKLMFIGRISPFKGVHLLIDALKELPQEEVSLDIYGPTNDSDYEQGCRANTAGMPNVRWMGKVPQAAVIATMQQYHALCLPSTFSEMSPLVVQEAFAAGIPVIASNIYGNAEQVTHDENGLLFSFNNAAALKDQISRIIKSPELLEKLTANLQAPKSFKAVGEEYYQLYQEITDV